MPSIASLLPATAPSVLPVAPAAAGETGAFATLLGSVGNGPAAGTGKTLPDAPKSAPVPGADEEAIVPDIKIQPAASPAHARANAKALVPATVRLDPGIATVLADAEPRASLDGPTAKHDTDPTMPATPTLVSPDLLPQILPVPGQFRTEGGGTVARPAPSGYTGAVAHVPAPGALAFEPAATDMRSPDAPAATPTMAAETTVLTAAPASASPVAAPGMAVPASMVSAPAAAPVAAPAPLPQAQATPRPAVLAPAAVSAPQVADIAASEPAAASCKPADTATLLVQRSARGVRATDAAPQPDAPASSAPAPTTAIAPVAEAVAQSHAELPRHAFPTVTIDRIERLRDEADAVSTSIRVLPDALGAIDVSVRKEGEVTHVHLAAEQAQTRTLLAEAQPKLAEIAEQRGVRLGQTEVGGGSTGGQPTPQHHPSRQPAAPVRARADAPRSTPDHRIA